MSAESRLAAVLGELEPRFGVPVTDPAPIGGGLTNHNFRVRFENADTVLRIAGADTELLGIDRGAEAEATRNAHELAIGPEVLAEIPEHGGLLTAFVDGEPIASEVLRRDWIDELVRTLRTLHEGPPMSVDFDTGEVIRSFSATIAERGVAPHPFAAEAAAIVAAVQGALTGPGHERVPCHNDLLAANLLDENGRLWLVDWEYAGNNDRWFDLANLSVNNEFTEADDERMLSAYFGGCDIRALARLELCKLLSDAREAHWGALQSAVSSLEADFDQYADKHFGRLERAASGRRLEHLLATAA